MSDIKTTAAAVYQTLQAVHSAVASGDIETITDAVDAHHTALNDLRKLFAPWADFLAFIGAEDTTVAARVGGSGGKD